ncbi:MAG: hypothetical protein CSA58_12475, partial [Micrococcales bacterium]
MAWVGLSTEGMTVAARIDLLTALEKVKRAAVPVRWVRVRVLLSCAVVVGCGRVAGFAGPGRGRVVSDGTRLRRVGDTRSLGAQVALARRESAHRGPALLKRSRMLVHDMPYTLRELVKLSDLPLVVGFD